MTANELTKAVIKRINLIKGCMAYRSSNIPVRGKANTVKKGLADITCVVHGYAVYIEVKTGRDYQKEDQKAFQEEVENAGGYYWIVTSWDQFLSDWEMVYRVAKNARG